MVEQYINKEWRQERKKEIPLFIKERRRFNLLFVHFSTRTNTKLIKSDKL